MRALVQGWIPSTGGPIAPTGAPTRGDDAAPILLTQRPRIREQGEVGCCVSIAITGAIELLLAGARGRTPELSPMFHYWVARGDHYEAGPITFLAGLQAAITQGICLHRLHDVPFTLEGAARPPSAAAIAEAKARAQARYDPITGGLRTRFQFFRLPDHDRARQFRRTLADGAPIVFGFWQTPGYAEVHAGHPVHGATLAPRQDVGHAALIVGHRPGRGFLVADARGRGFAERGTWWLPDALLETPLIQESWTLRQNPT
ncbi:MAG: hypothetical protein R3B09_33720 [Nannocystaceae bacterium]